MEIPLYLKLKTNKENYTWFTGGLGVSWLFSAHRKVSNVVRILNKDTPNITEIANEQFMLRNNKSNQIGTFYQIGGGQIFRIKQIKFFAEFSFRQDINEWIYKAIETPSGIYEYPIKRQSLRLKIGMYLKNKKNG
ncbi:MAG: hypothetical protein GXO89_00495 [Chlorobi bacterium]|nr:hypothetical protein [Chlorobiota bacterium]